MSNLLSRSMMNHNRGWSICIVIYWMLQGIYMLFVHEGGIFPIILGGVMVIYSIFQAFYNYRVMSYIYFILIIFFTLYFLIFVVCWDIFTAFTPWKLLFVVWLLLDCLFIYYALICFSIGYKKQQPTDQPE